MATNRVLGIEALRRKLLAIPKIVRGELQSEMNAAANEIVSLQKQLVSPNTDSGDLQMSIRSEPFSKGGIGVLIMAGGPLTTRKVGTRTYSDSVVLGSGDTGGRLRMSGGKNVEYDYALANELGTQEMLAQPFFYPAFRQKKKSVNRRSAKAVKKAVEKAMKT